MPMQLQWTNIQESEPLAVEMLIADDSFADQATEFVHIRILSEKPKANWHLPAIQREVLERARDVLIDEIQNAQKKLDRAPA